MKNNKLRCLILCALMLVSSLAVYFIGQPSVNVLADNSAASTDSMQTVGSTTNENEFRVGMEAGYAPFNWTQIDDSNGAVPISGNQEYAGGYDVEIAKIIADKLGKKLVIVKTEWDGLVPALTSGKIDAIIAGMSPTKERKKTIDFTDSYYKSDLVVVVKKDSKYLGTASIQDLKGAKLTGQLNTFHYSVIDQIDGVQKQTAMDNFTAMRVAVESGMIDGYISERPEAVSATNLNKNLAMIEFEDGFDTDAEDTEVAVSIRKNSPLTKQINNILKTISEEKRAILMNEAIHNQPASGEHVNWLSVIIRENWPMFLRGAAVTLYISMIGTIIGSIIGLLVGVIRTIPMPEKGLKKRLLRILNILLNIYIEVFRGTPMIVQAMVIYYGSALAFNINMNRIAAAIFIVSVNTGAYMSEIVRGGIVSIDKGQFEAASAIGMNHLQTMRNIILPQVVRNILPATGNEFVINIKDTSVLNVISVTELFFQTKSVAGNNVRYFESFFVASVLYLIMTFTVTRILRYIEKKMDGPSNYMMLGNQMQVSKIENNSER